MASLAIALLSGVKLPESSVEQFPGARDGVLRGEIYRGSTRAIEVPSGDGCWSPLQSSPLGAAVSQTLRLILVTPDPLPCSYPSLDVSLCQSLRKLKQKWVLQAVPKKLGKLGAHPGEGKSLGPGSSLLALDSAIWGMG